MSSPSKCSTSSCSNPRKPNNKKCEDCWEKQKLRIQKSREKKRAETKKNKVAPTEEKMPASKKSRKAKEDEEKVPRNSGFTTCIADAPYISEAEEEPEEDEDEEQEEEADYTEEKEDVRRQVKKGQQQPWWKQEQYQKHFIVPNVPLISNNPHTEHFLSCSSAWANCHDMLLCPRTFLEVLLRIDPNAVFNHEEKKVTSAKMGKALNASLYYQHPFLDFPKIVKISRASADCPTWIYVDLQFPGPMGHTYTFCKMKTRYWLINQYRYEDDALDELLDKYVAEQKKADS